MADEFDVAVIGAGAAGVAAARRVAGAGRRVLLLEASQRVGGRAWTETVAGLPLDLGCGWLHSADRNPLVAVAGRAGFAIDRSAAAWGRQWRDLGFSRADREEAWESWGAFNARMVGSPPPSDRASDALEPGNRWNGYLNALSGYLNGADLAELSVADYLAYDDAATMENWRLPAGYGTLIASQARDIPVALATPVEAIDLSGKDVRLQTPAGTVSARAAVLAVSSCVLASDAIRLPGQLDAHRAAAAALPLGLADKIFIQLREGHGLEAETHLTGNPGRGDTGSYYIMPFGRPVIEGFFGGSAAEALEGEGLAGAFAFAADELCALLGGDFRRKIGLLTGSAWRRMDRIGGSYSHAQPGKAGCRAVLARPCENRVFFAGEATHPTDFSTAHGAWQSGERAADEVLAALKP